MITCINCGAEIEETSNFCPRCGARCERGKYIERSVYVPTTSVADIQKESETQNRTYPLKWHNCLMVVMILGGIITVANGINYVMGLEYTGFDLYFMGAYKAFPALKSCNMFYGIAMIAIGIFEFIVRRRLNQFRENGPMSLKILYILSIAVNMVYDVWASSATNMNLFSYSSISSYSGIVILFVINSIYYSKRSELFVN